MDTIFKVIFIAFSIFAAAKSEQNSTKRIPVKSGNLLLDHNWPRLKSGLTRFPHRSSCQHFYSPDPEGQFKLRKCPTGLIFDFVTLKCGRETLSQCWSSQFDHGYKPLYHRKHFHCPLPWGRYPDILNCKKYFQCRGKKAHYRTCPSSTLFDKTKSRCVPETLAICSDAAEVEKYYKCPRSRGLFMYSRDCSKFHDCRKRISRLRSCKLGYLFDSTSNKCRSKDEVVCGRRYNPYGETTTSDPNVQRSTVTQGVHKEKFQNYLMETSQNADMKASESATYLSLNVSDGSSEILDDSSSEELFNLTYNIATDDSSEEFVSGVTDLAINSSSKELLVRIAETYHKNASQDFSTDIAGTTHEIPSREASTISVEVAFGSSPKDLLTGTVETVHVSSAHGFPTGTVEATYGSSSQNSSTNIAETTHEITSPDFSLKPVKVSSGSSSRNLSTETVEIVYGSSAQDFPTRTAETAHGSSSQDFSTIIAGVTHKIPAQDFSVRTVEVDYGSSSRDLSKLTVGTVHGSSSHDFSVETVPYSNEILKLKADNSEKLQEVPFVKLFTNRRSA